jgi:hypothetical protein
MNELHAFSDGRISSGGDGWNEVAHPGLDLHTLDWFSLD